jgi:hypothetical protein
MCFNTSSLPLSCSISSSSFCFSSTCLSNCSILLKAASFSFCLIVYSPNQLLVHEN